MATGSACCQAQPQAPRGVALPGSIPQDPRIGPTIVPGVALLANGSAPVTRAVAAPLLQWRTLACPAAFGAASTLPANGCTGLPVTPTARAATKLSVRPLVSPMVPGVHAPEVANPAVGARALKPWRLRQALALALAAIKEFGFAGPTWLAEPRGGVVKPSS
mmetsp:Transcript_21729/g.60283  ORF Transcript_21729/g.60283 Transcript_21729/m.60283 type:complete len:162 (-) Transcript_21729:184-669(-)